MGPFVFKQDINPENNNDVWQKPGIVKNKLYTIQK